MPKILFVFLVLCLPQNLFAGDLPESDTTQALGENNTSETTQTGNEVATESSSSAPAEEPENSETKESAVAAAEPVAEPQGNPAVDCTSMFLEMIKTQPAKEQGKFMDDYFSLSNGYQYRSDKNDEFVWKEKESQYQKLYAATLAEKTVYELYSMVKLGKYDFKKKGFPVEVAVDKAGILKTFYRSGFSMGGIGGPYMGSDILCSGMGMTKHTPNQLLVKIQNLKQLQFISVPEEVAKGITAELGGDRLAFATFTVDILKIKSTQEDKLRLGVKNNVYDIAAKAQKVVLTVGTQTVGEVAF